MIKLPPGVDINNLIEDLKAFSWEAYEILFKYSKIIKDSNNKSKILINKNEEDPVTIADLKVNEIMIKNFAKKYNNIEWEIISEENVKENPNNRRINKNFVWLLDPLDGTRDFIQGTGNYAMHLALNCRNKPYLGIVLIPDKNELWISNHDKVWCENKHGEYKKPNLSSKDNLKDMTIVTSKNHNNQILHNLIKKANFKKVIVMGSIGCKIASIIRGESDIYICLSLPGKSSPKDWDFSAPAAALKAAGGAITNLHNEELTYGNSNFEQSGIIIATSNYLNHEKTCSQIKEVINKFDLYPFN